MILFGLGILFQLNWSPKYYPANGYRCSGAGSFELLFLEGVLFGEGFEGILHVAITIIWKIRPFLSDSSQLRGIASAAGGKSMKRKAKNGFDEGSELKIT